MDKSKLKKVYGQTQLTRMQLEYSRVDDLINYTKERLAENIGREMMKNNLIQFEDEYGPDLLTVKASTLVYDKNEEDENKKEKENYLNDDALDKIATTIALLTRHEYWSKSLWKTREATKDKYKNYDVAEVHNAFLALRLKKCCIYTTPVGMCWAHNVSGINDVEKAEKVDDYYSDYEDLFKDYRDWQYEQR
mgnify:CR=1 FL=1